MRNSQLAVTLYTVRQTCQTAQDLAVSLRKIREIGYETIQVSGIGDIPAREVARIAADHGLRVGATHEQAQQLLEAPAQAIEKLALLGCRFTAYPYPAGIDLADRAAVVSLADRLQKSAEEFRSAGMVLGYHNHSLEFAKHDGITILDFILSHATDLALELDTYWVQHGGGDPVAYCGKYAGRIPALHLKDYVIRNGQPDYAEIGNGNLDFPRIIQAAENGGTNLFIVEQDTTPGDPFESLRQSYQYLFSHFCRS